MSSEILTPRVFLSHASDDKERFVLGFATKLRAQGVDVWLDRWEMQPGDSIVQKIFEEGLKHASAVVVVLSKKSVDKPWVRQELDVAVVKKINTGSKLIPVIIDDCEIPEALRATLWERIEDINNYEPSLQRIVAAIFGQHDKPALGEAPAYVHTVLSNVPGLNKSDNLVLKLSCEAVLKNDDDRVNVEDAFRDGEKWRVPEEEILESLDMLDRQGYIQIANVVGPKFPHYRVTTFGFESYAKAYIPDYNEKLVQVVSAIVNEKREDSHALRDATGLPMIMVEFFLDILENAGHVKLSRLSGRLTRAYNISPALRRLLSGAS